MSKKKKFKGNNAKLVGDTRLTQREMKKFQAAYHNVNRDNASKLLDVKPTQTDLGGVADLGVLE